MDDGRAGKVTFADLELLLSFADTEHFGQTATELGVSVATVQRGIRALERKLEIRLVEQDGRRVRMLPAGHVLVREAHAVLRARSDAVGAALADAGEPQRLLRIAHTYSLGLGFVPGVLADLLEERPELRLRCTQSPATGVVEMLLRGDADAAFSSVAPIESDLVVEPLFTESLLLAVPVDDELAGRERVSLREVSERPFVAMEPGSSSRTHMVNACARAGFVPRISVEGNDLFVVESMVGAGIGVSVVPEGMNDHQHPRITRIPIDDPSFSGRTIFLAWHRSSTVTDNVQTLARIARAHGKRMSEPLRRVQ